VTVGDEASDSEAASTRLRIDFELEPAEAESARLIVEGEIRAQAVSRLVNPPILAEGEAEVELTGTLGNNLGTAEAEAGAGTGTVGIGGFGIDPVNVDLTQAGASATKDNKSPSIVLGTGQHVRISGSGSVETQFRANGNPILQPTNPWGGEAEGESATTGEIRVETYCGGELAATQVRNEIGVVKETEFEDGWSSFDPDEEDD
jgi:hypothetical protein